ncbi:glycosyltransferase family 4 protein [Synechococcus sp. AH-707-B22]|nr:glycosyltransferase family 4 protein [Synechococcus sp. AH-707-B22]
MKHLWIVNHYAQEPSGPGGTRHFSFARHLLEYDWKTFIIASSCEHNTGRQRLGDFETLRADCVDGVDFLWLKVAFEPISVLWLRLFAMFSFAFTVLKPASTRALPLPDLVIGSTVHPFAALAACFLARRYRVPFVFEVRDLWPRTLVAMGAIRADGPFDLFFGWLERWLAFRSSSVVVLMPGGIDYFHSLGIPRQRLVWLPNGAELSDFPPPPTCIKAQPFRLVYCGSHGPANALDTVLDAMALLQKRGVSSNVLMLRMIGDGSCKAELQQRARDLGLLNVIFEPPVPKKVLASLISEADGFVVAMQRLPELYRYGISFNKLFDYFQAARPIVSASCAAYDPVLAADAGFVVPADDPFALAQGIDKLRQLPFLERQRLGLNGRAYLEENHSYERLGQRLASHLDALVSPDENP